MNLKTVYLTLIIVTACLFLPLIASGADINWTSESYRAYSYAAVYNDTILLQEISEERFGPPLAIYSVAGTSPSYCAAGEALTYITENYMSVSAEIYTFCNNGTYADANGNASFTGIFTAVAPAFIFDYSFNSIYGDSRLYVNDLTAGTSSQIYLFDADTVMVPLTVGNDIEVSFDISYNTLNYSMAVVPEPISCILFVTGGTVLAGRHYIKRKNKA